MMEKIRGHFKSKRSLKRFIFMAIALFALVCASIYTVFIKPGMSEEKYVYKEETVQKGDLILGIMESGSIVLEESSLDYSLEIITDEDDDDEEDDDEEEDEETQKYLEVEEAYVVSGQRITEGEQCFKLTEDSVKAVRKKLTALYTEAQITLAEAQTEYEIQLLQAKSTYDTSVLEANRAATEYQASTTKTQEAMESLAAQNKVLEAEITYYNEQLADEDLWESLEDAKSAFTSAENIYKDTDYHNATAYASNYADYKSAKEALDTIQEQIDQWNESIEANQESIAKNQKEMAEAQSSLEVENLTNKSSYDNAVLGGELAEDIYSYTVNSLEEAVTTAKADMETAKSNLEELEAFVGEDGIITANGDGLVTSVSYSEGDDLINTGAMLNYVKENAYTVTIDVSEEDISAITVGDKVDITMTAYPEVLYVGTVTAITTTATSDYATTISYPITIKLEGDTSLLYGGMTAEVTFVTDSVTDVLYVSRKAIQEMDGKVYVYTKGAAGNKKLTEVETGFSDGSNIEITSGLAEGDVIYIESKISGSEQELTESSTEPQNIPRIPESGEQGEETK